MGAVDEPQEENDRLASLRPFDDDDIQSSFMDAVAAVV